MNVTYTFDGLIFKSYGVYVSKSTGWFGKPARKKPEIYEYPEESGFVADLKTVAYEARRITLECFIKQPSLALIESVYNTFSEAIQGKTATKTLSIVIATETSVSFQVYVEELTELQSRNAKGVNVGTFKITFVEPQLPTPPAP